MTDALPENAWQTVQWREGSQGPLSRRFVALRVHAGTGCVRHSESHGRSWTGPQIWLLAERPLVGELGDPEWFVSNMPAGTPLSRLVELAHLRLPHRAMLQGCQRRVWSGPVSRPQLACTSLITTLCAATTRCAALLQWLRELKARSGRWPIS